ncbi:MAG: UvrD-helicase domain-containing protein [Bdellovibrio sp.]|nr:UvrD-helicase domain-containing protein [Bdellovibrio sp.]
MVEQCDLNDEQKNAVKYFDGPMMVLAGAGSGKTRMLVAKISHLLGVQNVGPYKILALTFSNKAAHEMRERVARLCGINGHALAVTTFHSFCARLLRTEFEFLGLSKNFSIYDEDESKVIVKSILSKYGISPKEISPYDVLSYIDDLKNKGVYTGRENVEALGIDLDDPFLKYFYEYEHELHRSNALDFGGLITSVLCLLERHPHILKRLRGRYEFILVDEYQDTNKAQFELLRLLADEHNKICVVGDEDQSIYSWRGADINNILDFEKHFKNVKIVKLEQNYRSSAHIINAASAVIANNVLRKGKQLWTENSEGEKITIAELETEKDEANFVMKAIGRLRVSDQEKYNDFAIFYRNNFQSRPFEDVLRQNNIPYRIVGGIKFYDRKEIKDVLGYLRLIVNVQDSLALSRIINVPTRGIGATTLRKLEDLASQLNISLWAGIGKLLEGNEDFGIRLTPKIRLALKNFNSFLSECIYLYDKNVAPKILFEKVIHESGYLDELRAMRDYESAARIENIEELGRAIEEFQAANTGATLADFIESITLDTTQMKDSDNHLGEISLMTVHGAKGLEFPFVFVVGAEEGIFPSSKSMEAGQNSIEEERRLFYVAMTRAMKKLHITFVRGRFLWGQLKFNGPSRFLFEIPKDSASWPNNKAKISSDELETRETQGSFDDYDFSQKVDHERYIINESKTALKYEGKFQKGNRVIHSVYGKGKVLETEGFGAEEKVLIIFPDGAKKKFLVKFAPIMIDQN